MITAGASARPVPLNRVLITRSSSGFIREIKERYVFPCCDGLQKHSYNECKPHVIPMEFWCSLHAEDESLRKDPFSYPCRKTNHFSKSHFAINKRFMRTNATVVPFAFA